MVTEIRERLHNVEMFEKFTRLFLVPKNKRPHMDVIKAKFNEMVDCLMSSKSLPQQPPPHKTNALLKELVVAFRKPHGAERTRVTEAGRSREGIGAEDLGGKPLVQEGEPLRRPERDVLRQPYKVETTEVYSLCPWTVLGGSSMGKNPSGHDGDGVSSPVFTLELQAFPDPRYAICIDRHDCAAVVDGLLMYRYVVPQSSSWSPSSGGAPQDDLAATSKSAAQNLRRFIESSPGAGVVVDENDGGTKNVEAAPLTEAVEAVGGWLPERTVEVTETVEVVTAADGAAPRRPAFHRGGSSGSIGSLNLENLERAKDGTRSASESQKSISDRTLSQKNTSTIDRFPMSSEGSSGQNNAPVAEEDSVRAGWTFLVPNLNALARPRKCSVLFFAPAGVRFAEVRNANSFFVFDQMRSRVMYNPELVDVHVVMAPPRPLSASATLEKTTPAGNIKSTSSLLSEAAAVGALLDQQCLRQPAFWQFLARTGDRELLILERGEEVFLPEGPSTSPRGSPFNVTIKAPLPGEDAGPASSITSARVDTANRMELSDDFDDIPPFSALLFLMLLCCARKIPSML